MTPGAARGAEIGGTESSGLGAEPGIASSTSEEALERVGLTGSGSAKSGVMGARRR